MGRKIDRTAFLWPFSSTTNSTPFILEPSVLDYTLAISVNNTPLFQSLQTKKRKTVGLVQWFYGLGVGYPSAFNRSYIRLLVWRCFFETALSSSMICAMRSR